MATAVRAAAGEQPGLSAADHADRQRRAAGAQAPGLFDLDRQPGHVARVRRAGQRRAGCGDARAVREALTAYPDGWLRAGGPSRIRHGRGGTRHAPARTGVGGHHPCGQITHDSDRESVW